MTHHIPKWYKPRKTIIYIYREQISVNGKIKNKKSKRRTKPEREWGSSRLSPWFLSLLLVGERHWEGFAEAYSHLQSFERTSHLLYHLLYPSFFLRWKIKSFWIWNSKTVNYVLRAYDEDERKKKKKKMNQRVRV